MTIIKCAALIVALIFSFASAASTQAQTPASDFVRVTTASNRVHISTGSDLFETRVEVSDSSGEIVFESGIISGNSFDWQLTDSLGARVPAGDYNVTVTYRTPQGKRKQRVERVTVKERTGEQSGGAVTSNQAVTANAVAPIEGEGAAGKIAKFNGTNSITSSTVLTESAGKIGVTGSIEVGAASGVGLNPLIINPKNIANFALVQFYPASGTNVNTSFAVIPKGTGVANNRAQFSVFNTDYIANSTNYEFASLRARGSDFIFGTGRAGTGVIRPLVFSAGYLTDNTTNANQLVLATNGSVGVGTATPDDGYELVVDGRELIKTNSATGGGRIEFGSPNTETGMAITGAPGSPRADIRFNGDSLKLTAGTGGIPAATNGIVIRKEGAIGIGVETPSLGRLQVVNQSTAIHATSTTSEGVVGLSTDYYGLYGKSTNYVGVFGRSDAIQNAGVSGVSPFEGVHGEATGTSVDAAAIYGKNTGPGWAGFFDGKVGVTSGLTVDGGCAGCDPPSDRNLKANFSTVNPRFILDRLATIPIQTWNYKRDPMAVRHIGAMAQDFRAAFNFGTGDKTLSTVDAQGVTMAAIQGLYQMMLERDRRIEQLQNQVRHLQRIVKQQTARRKNKR